MMITNDKIIKYGKKKNKKPIEIKKIEEKPIEIKKIEDKKIEEKPKEDHKKLIINMKKKK